LHAKHDIWYISSLHVLAYCKRNSCHPDFVSFVLDPEGREISTKWINKSSDSSSFSALNLEAIFYIPKMYSLTFPLPWYFMEIKFWRRVLISALSLFCKALFNFNKEFFGTTYIIWNNAPKDLKNATLNDHKTHAIWVIPLLMKFPLFRGTGIRRRRGFLNP